MRVMRNKKINNLNVCGHYVTHYMDDSRTRMSSPVVMRYGKSLVKPAKLVKYGGAILSLSLLAKTYKKASKCNALLA